MEAGIVVVVAAGNYGRVSVNGSNGFGTITAPGNDPYVLTVGAMKSNGSSSPAAETLASYSSKGPTTYDHVVKPDVVAPGNDIVSLSAPGATLEADYPAELVTGNDGNNDYFTLSGTSMATPVVAGAVCIAFTTEQRADSRPGEGAPDEVHLQTIPTLTNAFVPHLLQTFTSFYDMLSLGRACSICRTRSPTLTSLRPRWAQRCLRRWSTTSPPGPPEHPHPSDLPEPFP